MSKDEALKMAISQFKRIDKEYDCTEIIDICKEALEQSAQEIVCKVFDIDNFHSSVLDRIKFTSPQQWQGLSDDEINDKLKWFQDNQLFTQQMRTEMEWASIWFKIGVQWAEQALKEKNT